MYEVVAKNALFAILLLLISSLFGCVSIHSLSDNELFVDIMGK